MMEWIEYAACQDKDLSIFFPRDKRLIREAKRICSGCPVQKKCLDFALSVEGNWSRYGVWGGLTPEERERFRRR